jgi:hypothetical protein
MPERPFDQIGFVFVIRAVAVICFSPRALCRFDLAVRAISIRRRIASEREGLSGRLTLFLVPVS